VESGDILDMYGEILSGNITLISLVLMTNTLLRFENKFTLNITLE